MKKLIPSLVPASVFMMMAPPAALLAQAAGAVAPAAGPGTDTAAEADGKAPGDTGLSRLLREALFDEQGLRDLDKAAAGYGRILASWEESRPIAATALYRLAEIHRAQNRREQAVALYQRVVTEFPGMEPLARLSRENLAALGVEVRPRSPEESVADEEEAKIAELKKMLKESPDLVRRQGHTSPMSAAVFDGQMKVVRFLLDAGVKPTDEDLVQAADNGHLGVCTLLLDHELPLAGSRALLTAVRSGRTEIVRLLLERGADPNAVEESTGGNPLFDAAAKPDALIFHLLLEKGASPGLPPPANSAFARLVAGGRLPEARKMLAAGADLNGRVKGVTDQDPARGVTRLETPFQAVSADDRESMTVVHLAVISGSLPMLDWILSQPVQGQLSSYGQYGDRQVTPLGLVDYCFPGREPGGEIRKRLLRAGANPGMGEEGGNPPLFSAALAADAETVKLLMEAGADFRFLQQGRNLLSFLGTALHEQEQAPGRRQQLTAVVRLLMEAGLSPAGGNMPYLETVQGAAAVEYAREFLYPDWNRTRRIMLCFPFHGMKECHVLTAEAAAGESPRSFPDLLLEWNGKQHPVHAKAPDWSRLRLIRRGADGAEQIQVTDNWVAHPPKLEWGDILEFLPADWENPETSSAPLNALRLELPEKMRTALAAHLERRVTVKLDGNTLPITLRGRLKVYNPLKPEAPLTDAVSLMRMMGAGAPEWQLASVKITRQPEQGGGVILSPLRSVTPIPLREGDVLELAGERTLWRQNGWTASPGGGTSQGRLDEVVLLSPGLAFSRSLPLMMGDEPTLLEFLAACWPGLEREACRKLAAENGGVMPERPDAAALAEALRPVSPHAVLPHPDFARVKILRLPAGSGGGLTQENRELVEVPVNLGEAIAACTDATTPEEARRADVVLRAGDRVLVPVREESRDQPWNGFDAAATRFFSKALSMMVTLADVDGSFRGVSLEYLPVRYLETEAGLLGLPAVEPSPHRLNEFTAPAVVGLNAPGRHFRQIQRAGWEPERSAYWLRPDDVIMIGTPAAPLMEPPGTRALRPALPAR